MATKRKYFEMGDIGADDPDNNIPEVCVSNKKHTLDSDEEDSDEYEKEDLHDSDVEGEEDGDAVVHDDIKITPFNMREELREGHFDKDGHYHWNKLNDIKDNWLDNIDWLKIKNECNTANKDDSSTLETLRDAFNEVLIYEKILPFMKFNENINEALQRLGKNRKRISSVERIKQKKLGIVDEAAEKITKLTELANEILNKTGNMDIYQMTYQQMQDQINAKPGPSKAISCDMYDDSFNEKEKLQLASQQVSQQNKIECSSNANPNEQLWEFKWKQTDDKLEGPFNTKQMLKWSQDGYFKDGVFVRKFGETSNFYTSNRIDFDLYL